MDAVGQRSYFIETSHGRVHVWDSFGKDNKDGDELPLYIIHGNSGSGQSFFRQVATADYSPEGKDEIYDDLDTLLLNDFAKNRRVVLIDLPGHGRSSPAINPEATYNVIGYGDTVLEVAASISGLDAPIALFGQSLGGHAAIHAAKTSHNVAKLILSGTPPVEISFEGFSRGCHFDPELGAIFASPAFTDEEAKLFMGKAGYEVEKYPFFWKDAKKTNELARPTLLGSLVKKIGGDQEADMKALDIPICIIHGKDDKGICLEPITSIEPLLKTAKCIL